MEDFLKEFSPHDYVTNDHMVGQRIRELIHAEEDYPEDSVDGSFGQCCETRKRALESIKSDV